MFSRPHTDKRVNKVFLHIEGNSVGIGCKGFPVFEEMRKFFTCMRMSLVMYDFAPDPSEFPYI
jgi:hypothetical protein